MEKSRFFFSVDGDRRYTPDDWAEYFGAFVSNGVFPIPANALQVLPGTIGTSVIVRPGRGWIGGKFYENTAPLTLEIPLAHPSLRRIDRVVLRCDMYLRKIFLTILPGNPATNPLPTPLTRNADAFELCLADVTVNAGAVAIVQGNINCQRLNTAVCGLVVGLVTQIDPTSFFEQYTAFLLQQIDDWHAIRERYTEKRQEYIDEWQGAMEARNEQTAAQLLAFRELLHDMRLLLGSLETQSFTFVNNNFEDFSVRRGCDYLTTFNADGSILEAITVVALDFILATKHTEFLTGGDILETITFNPWEITEGGITTHTTAFELSKRTRFLPDGRIMEEVR